ncbi:hypothetical protein K490DRAFT_65509 [Saccharata proteae CBS 121410]|uniref:Myb-like domain-containing protein n=1 Tax=Saccharata proteae CBS 121410 TaxID=1314787 RepID=A0A9P4HVN9_9PEZI|nr:hypothetical protein K490DRAFT_65509 [Saccharata proteae CBS 121410]
MPKEVRPATTIHRVDPMPLTPTTSNGPARGAAQWLQGEDQTLMQARASGLGWKPIASRYFPDKTDNACRKRYERLMARRNAEEWDGGVRLETLATEYMNVRKEMWSILGDRIGEKWQVVEMKCMERGLKNIQAAARSAQRKERGNSDLDEGDSGIGFSSDAENEIEDCSLEAPQTPRAVHIPSQHEDDRMQRGGPSIQSMLSPSPSHMAPHSQQQAD